MDDLEYEHQERDRDPSGSGSGTAPPPPKPKPAPPKAKKVRLVLRIVSGSMQPVSDATVNLHEFGKGAKSNIPLSEQDGALVGEVTTAMPSLSLFVSRPTNPFPRVYSLHVHGDGKVDGDKDVLLRIVNRTDASGNVADVQVIYPRVTDITQSLKLTGHFASLINKWVLPKTSIPIVDMAQFASGQDMVMNFVQSEKVEAEIVIFDVEGLKVKRPVAVAFPKGLAEFQNMMLFFHHTIGQNLKEFKKEGPEFPFGMAFLLFGFFHYLGGKRAMAYQIAAAHRKVVMVLPMPDFQGVGEFDSDPVLVKDVLLEIIGHLNRVRKQDFTPPQLGRFAVASYSSGIRHTLEFFHKGGSLLNSVNEVYDIDGAHSSFRRQLSRGSFSGNGRLVRRYEQGWPGWPEAHRLGTLNPAIFALPWFRWLNEASFPFPGKSRAEIRQLIRKQPLLEKTLGGYVHGVMPAYMLFHALSLSQFPKF